MNWPPLSLGVNFIVTSQNYPIHSGAGRSPPESLNYSMLHADQLHLMWDWLSASLETVPLRSEVSLFSTSPALLKHPRVLLPETVTARATPRGHPSPFLLPPNTQYSTELMQNEILHHAVVFHLAHETNLGNIWRWTCRGHWKHLNPHRSGVFCECWKKAQLQVR